MKRRRFAKLTGSGMLIPLIEAKTNVFWEKGDVKELMPQLIRVNDSRIPTMLAKQEKDASSKWYGGIKNESEVFYAGHAAGFIKSLSCSYVSEKSEYYESTELLKAMLLASEYLLHVQYSDGNIDLPSTNFHSPPDTAFVVEPLCIAYGLLSNLKTSNLSELLANLKKFLLLAGTALTVGGIHTANHRWVVCMALARLNELFPNQSYLGRIDQWLTEKIDIDPDGQYAERSTLIYTPLVNRCLITTARLTDKPELFEPVRKNLVMTLFYIHPNGEIATESSGRQDRYQQGTMENYLYAYLYMGILDGNGRFAAATGEIIGNDPAKLLFWLGYLLEDPFLLKSLSVPDPLPRDYLKAFYHSDLVRIRREAMDASILSDNPIFLTFFKGNAALESVRMASAFFGKGQFKAQSMERSGDSFILTQRLIGPYYQPLEVSDIPEDGNGWEVPRMKRQQSEVQEQLSVIEIKEENGQIELKIKVEGTDNVPVAIEFAFRHGGMFNQLEEVNGISNAYLASQGKMMQYSIGQDTIEFGPGIRAHAWTQLRGALPKLDADSVYFTGFTPFRFTIKIS